MIREFRYQSKFGDNFKHVEDYIKLVNEYYSQWQFSTLKVTYYNLDIEDSNIDEDKLVGGSYEMVGDLSGWRWRKILDFEINGAEAVSTTPVNDERGVTMSDKLTTAYFPKTNGLVPKVHDFICFSQLNTGDNYILRNPPLYEVVNVERSNDTDLCFYKINLKVSYVTKQKIECQLSELLHYYDYEKHIYPIDQSIVLNQLLYMQSQSQLNSIYDQNSGLYMDQFEC